MRVPQEVYDEAERLKEQNDMTMKEAIRQMCREGGFDV
jgi:hypothetical protein